MGAQGKTWSQWTRYTTEMDGGQMGDGVDRGDSLPVRADGAGLGRGQPPTSRQTVLPTP